MLTNLWFIGIFYLASTLVALAFLAYAWIYFDAYIVQKRSKDFFRAIGGVLVAIYFIIGIITFRSDYATTLYLLLILTSGLFSIFYGNLLEPVPGLPDEKPEKLKSGNYIAMLAIFIIGIILAYLSSVESFSRVAIGLSTLLFLILIAYIYVGRKRFLSSVAVEDLQKNYKSQRSLGIFLLVIPFYTSLLLAVIIILQNLKKVVEGLSKEFRFLYYFWLVFTIYVLYETFARIGAYYFVSLDSIIGKYSLFWVISQTLLILAAYLMYRWIAMFISFRIVAKVFLYVWQICIVLTVALVTIYSIFIISSSESQISDLLGKNASLIELNLNQIKENNLDMLSLIKKDQKFINALSNSNIGEIENSIGSFISSNSFLDKVQVLDSTGLLIFDSESVTSESLDLQNNYVIKSTIYTRSETSGFVIESYSTSQDNSLVYYFAVPILKDDGAIIGIIASSKDIDDSYLDLLKDQTDQELVVYINNKRSASTLVERDGVSRLQNIPLVLSETLSNKGNVAFYKGRILSTSYYFAVLGLQMNDSENTANLVISVPQRDFVESTQSSLSKIFILSLGLIILSSIPSYYLAINLKKNISA